MVEIEGHNIYRAAGNWANSLMDMPCAAMRLVLMKEKRSAVDLHFLHF